MESLIENKNYLGLEILPGQFVMDRHKFLISQYLGLKSKSKMVRNASRHLLLAYSLTTGEEISFPEEPPEVKLFINT
jgi:hypothetical protein